MKAIVLCEEGLDQIYKKDVFQKFNLEDCVIITTENSLYRQIQEKYPQWKCEIVNMEGNTDFFRAKTFSEQIMHDAIQEIGDVDTKNIAEISVNSLYEIYTSVIVEIDAKIHFLRGKYNIDEIYLYGGNSKAPFFPLNMAEGERPYTFLYKRRWFLNPLIKGLFSDDIKIYWKQESRVKLLFLRELRLLIINIGKIFKIILKHNKKNLSCNNVVGGGCVGIVVRTVSQLNSINPIYRAIEARTKCSPILLAYENYANAALIENIQKKNLNFINIRNYSGLVDIVKSYKKIKISGKRRTLHIHKKIEISSKYLLRELKVQWWDAAFLMNSFDKAIFYTNTRIQAIINIETYNWVAAAQAKWAKRNKYPIYTVQFVTLGLVPRIVWADKFFFMSLKEIEKYGKDLKKNECGYVGPICYDDIYNSTMHKTGELTQVLILTQPDSYKEDSIRLINDVLSIKEEMGLLIDITIKLHPREKDIIYFKNRYEYKAKVIFNEVDSTELLIHSDLAIGITSTTLYQSVIVGTPAISYNYNNFKKGDLDVVDEGVVKNVVNLEELKMCLVKFRSYEDDYINMRKKYLKKCLGNYCGKGAADFADIIEERINKGTVIM